MAETDSKKRLLGKVAVVTGAGRGLGRAEAMLLARQGAKVVVNDTGCDPYGRGTDESIARSVVDEIKGEGYDAVANYDTVATMEGAGKILDIELLDHIILGQQIFTSLKEKRLGFK
jgi:3-oxoacyl-[acyl-carrier protein] reductase